LAYEDHPIVNTTPVLSWVNRMGEGLYNHQSPDGFSMVASAWNGPGQMETRFEVARQLGSSAGGFFKPDTTASVPALQNSPTYPILRTALDFDDLSHTLAPATRGVLSKAASPQDWNTLFLSSPEFMNR